MTLPDNFDEWEHLQDTIRRWHNKAVGQWFKNQPENDISTPKRALRHACTMKDGDTSTMTMMRLWLFEVTAGHTQSLQTPIYGIPISEHERDIKYKPIVRLHFRQKLTAAPPSNRTRAVEQEISFRLINKTSETITRADAEILATNIKRELATPLFIIERGKYKVTYFDIERGYDLRLFVESEAEGIRVIKKILDIQSHPYNDDYFQFIKNNRTYPSVTGTHRVYGQTINKPVLRPTVPVRFRYAQLLIYGRTNHINLVAASDVGLKSVIKRF